MADADSDKFDAYRDEPLAVRRLDAFDGALKSEFLVPPHVQEAVQFVCMYVYIYIRL
jgi:hypothetical protein